MSSPFFFFPWKLAQTEREKEGPKRHTHRKKRKAIKKAKGKKGMQREKQGKKRNTKKRGESKKQHKKSKILESYI